MTARKRTIEQRAADALLGARAALDTLAGVLGEASFDPDERVFSVNDVLVIVLRAKHSLDESELVRLMTEGPS